MTSAQSRFLLRQQSLLRPLQQFQQEFQQKFQQAFRQEYQQAFHLHQIRPLPYHLFRVADLQACLQVWLHYKSSGSLLYMLIPNQAIRLVPQFRAHNNKKKKLRLSVSNGSALANKLEEEKTEKVKANGVPERKPLLMNPNASGTGTGTYGRKLDGGRTLKSTNTL
ncbi:uncharacterized protein J4E87_003764 [Alternaria ethzedia]|uniref:uncharacterized protein n=1 Tax=Alternaria ethzedia TaxID=181014 RepID=UPI0020C43CCC|nr:uncharacterized protein J4E87_003764 [Alternaria ethzedia]KAI4629500.1 hypothetical protein J4E87_003764 [Alternaria ethzedia]